MKIKHIIKTLAYTTLPLMGVAGALASCADIAEENRLIYVEPALAARNVLIEDFTGQRCTNCPKAADAIHEIQQIYGQNVVAVAIHCGTFGGINKKNPGLMTDTGKEYWDKWFDSSQGQPVAKINRGEPTNDYHNWANNVRFLLELSTDVSIAATTTFNNETRELDINVVTTALKGYTGKIQVWLTEDSIVARQDYNIIENGAEKTLYDHNYVHQHVFRAAVNGTWGEDITYNEGEQNLSWKTTLEEEWKPENLNVVVFVYDDNGVEQVIQVPAIQQKD